jgi:carbonic anhydrase
VPVELLFDTGFGDLFVVRNAGTMSTSAITLRDRGGGLPS